MEKRKIGKLFTFKDYGHTCALFSGIEGENITVYSGGDGSMYYFEHYTTEQWDTIVDEMENAVDYLESLTD